MSAALRIRKRMDAITARLPRRFMLSESGAPRGEARLYTLYCDGRPVKASAHLKVIENAVDSLLPLFALEQAEDLFRKVLPQFNWGQSALDADAIRMLNTVPDLVTKALHHLNAGTKS